MPSKAEKPIVGVVMGSRSDWGVMRHCADTLTELGVPHEVRVVSAHRTPDLMREYALTALSRGLRFIIAGAGGAAHLPGMLAAWSDVPVLGVPIACMYTVGRGLESLLSVVQMPRGTPVATFAVGNPGAVNAALFAARAIALSPLDDVLLGQLLAFRKRQAQDVLDRPDPRKE